jgi:hypothetical protein
MRSISICMCLLLVPISGCQPESSKTYSTHGIYIILTDTQWEREVDIAVVETHEKMANWILKDDGTKNDPSYKASSKTWKNNDGDKCTVSRLEFTSQEGNLNSLETICIPPEDLFLIYCESSDDNATIKLRNQLVKVLNARGFECID